MSDSHSGSLADSSVCHATFKIGEGFSSYEELCDRIRAYEEENSVQLHHRDSRTLDSAKNRVPKKVKGAKEELKYESIQLVCSFGVKPYKSKSSG